MGWSQQTFNIINVLIKKIFFADNPLFLIISIINYGVAKRIALVYI